MPLETLEKYGVQLKNYLAHFGEIGFTQDHEKNIHGFNYVGIELITTEAIVTELQEGINSGLNPQNGIILKLEFQKWGEQDKGRYRFKARIVSREPLGKQSYEEHLKTYIPQLRKSIHDAVYNHDTCRNRAKEIRKIENQRDKARQQKGTIGKGNKKRRA